MARTDPRNKPRREGSPVSGRTHFTQETRETVMTSRPIRSRNAFRRWLLYILDLPPTATYAQIRAALEKRLGIEP